MRALRHPAPLAAPPTLDEAVAREWAAPDEARFARILGSCRPHAAPDELAARLETEGLVAPFLRTLEPLAAPAVLERLVAEELLDPGLARARRFPGDLQRLDVPPSLTDRLHRASWLRTRKSAAPWVAAVAAAVLLWVGLRPDPDTQPSYSVRVRYASAADQDPLAVELAAALGGGSIHAIESVPGADPEEAR